MSSEQMRLVPGRDPGDIIRRAINEHSLDKIFVGFSGGKDSTVTLDYVWKNYREYIAGAYHIRTGISVPSTLDFSGKFCEDRGIPFIELRSQAQFDDMVRKYGFPGPPMHRIYYVELKEDPLAAFVQSQKGAFRERIGIITGVRAAESKRRGRTARDIKRKGATVWIAPLIDWSNEDMFRYRDECNVPMSEAARTLCMSGDCLCGAQAKSPDEIKPIKLFYPDIAHRIERLQIELKESSDPVLRQRWQYAPGPKLNDTIITPEQWDDEMPMCVNCAPTLFDEVGKPLP